MDNLNISVLGCGRWGSFLAWYARSTGHDVMVWGRDGSASFEKLAEHRSNEYLTLQDDVKLSHSLDEAVAFGEFLIIAISAQELRLLSRRLKTYGFGKDKVLVLCMKGIEADSGKRLSQVVAEEMGGASNTAVWVGPGHVQDYVKGIPNCMVIGSESIEVTKRVVENLGSSLIRFYYGQDLIGNEIGAASKNVIGIAAGMLDGFGYGSLKGALMARGAREISRLVRNMGGNELTVYGLSHLGDYEATLFSPHSHNRKFGEALVTGQPFDKLAEGASTVKGLLTLARQYNVELPISSTVHSVIYEGLNARDALENLFLRPVKFEF